MAPKVFLTGATGYIGGSVLFALATAHPEYNITVLLRSVPDAFSSIYPKVRVVRGDYDSSETLTEEAEKADIVVHNGDSDHTPSLQALIVGLLRRSIPGTLVHLSGTGIVADFANTPALGRLTTKIWSDADANDIHTIASLPDTALHRETEKLLFETAATHVKKIKIAIMCPPDIYGRGLGPGNTSSVLLSGFVVAAIKAEHAFYYGEGLNTRSWVHVEDLAALYVRVIEAATEENSEAFFTGPDGVTGLPAYFFAATQEHSHMAVSRIVASVLHRRGLIQDPEPAQVDLNVIDEAAKHPRFALLGRYLFAANSRTRAKRAEQVFDYKGQAPELLECVEAEVLAVLERASLL